MDVANVYRLGMSSIPLFMPIVNVILVIAESGASTRPYGALQEGSQSMANASHAAMERTHEITPRKCASCARLESTPALRAQRLVKIAAVAFTLAKDNDSATVVRLGASSHFTA